MYFKVMAKFPLFSMLQFSTSTSYFYTKIWLIYVRMFPETEQLYDNHSRVMQSAYRQITFTVLL